jgi:Protein of unknown function (DUF3995)
MTRRVRFALHASGVALSFVSALHLFWATGGRAPSSVVIPDRDGAPLLHPTRAQTLAVAALVGAAALLYHGNAAAARPRWLFRSGTATAGSVLIARAIGDGNAVGVTKRIRDTRFARMDTAVYSPLCAAIGLSGVIGALAD